MALPISLSSPLSNAWDVLMLFLIPIGGGIPAGVLLAKQRDLAWPEMVVLYFISDVILACVFEPVMLLLFAAARRSSFLTRLGEAYKQSMKKTTPGYGTSLGPFSLIMVAFGVDPMTGRSVAAAAGHRFLTGWALAITGDMMYFTVLMVSTLWLNNILGDGTKTMLIILVLMMVMPAVIRRIRERKRPST